MMLDIAGVVVGFCIGWWGPGVVSWVWKQLFRKN